MSLKKHVKDRFTRWLVRRLPPKKVIKLTQKRIFILPTKMGLAFGVLLLIMLVASINYQNSMGFMLTFLLGSIFIVSILHTYRNLSGLIVKVGRSGSGFCGEDIRFNILLSSTQNRHFNVELGWPGFPLKNADVDEGELQMPLFLKADKRGVFLPPRVLVQTSYPLGLLRAWSWLYLDMPALVFPKPAYGRPLPVSDSLIDEGDTIADHGGDDFAGLQDYQRGDSLKHVAWKQFARGRALYTKRFESFVDKQTWLDWECLPGVDVETRLSILCGWAMALSKKEEEYGLKLPGIELAPAKGPDHNSEVLKTLALFAI